mgnify:CR=1 FL=1
MDPTIRRFLKSGSACGSNARELSIGERSLRFEGLSDDQAGALERYWGPYLSPDSGLAVHRTVTVCEGGPGGWLDDPAEGELYRVEPLVAPEASITLSYAFALGEAPDGRWRVYGYDDLVARDKASLDIFWLRDDSLADSDNLPPPQVIAQEIVDDLEAALEQLRLIAGDLSGTVEGVVAE